MAIVSRIIYSVFSKNINSSGNIPRCHLPINRFASIQSASSEPQEDEFQDEKALAAAALEAKRNKSRLKPHHYKLLHGEAPVDIQNPVLPHQTEVPFQRRILGRFGEKSGVNLNIAWPSKRQLQDMIEYERVAHPFTVQEIVEKKRKLREEEEMKIISRQKDIVTKMGKLSGWMKELKDRREKKAAVERAAQEKKDRLIEEVRQHFGYVVSMKDPKFQEMLEQKEKDAKKAEKEAKKKDRFEKATTKAMAQVKASIKQENKIDA